MDRNITVFTQKVSGIHIHHGAVVDGKRYRSFINDQFEIETVSDVPADDICIERPYFATAVPKERPAFRLDTHNDAFACIRLNHIRRIAEYLHAHIPPGAGIAYVPLMWVINEINSGVLEILFPRYQSDPRPVYALYTEKDKLPLKVQVCINYLTEYFVEVAELFQGMRGRRKE